MKNLKIINFALFILICNVTMSMDDTEADIEEPTEKHIDVDFDEPIIDKKAKMKYTDMRYTVEPASYTPSPENLAREEKLKKFRQQEKAIRWHSKKDNEKIKDFQRKRAVTKFQRATRGFLKEKRIEKEKRIQNFKKTISTFADQSYPKFKELICTSDYLTKTDWLYQFIEKMENKTIFTRDKNGNIDSNEFSPEFKKEIENPSDWLHEKIIKYLPEFHKAIYETFIDKATEQIVKYKASWTDTVSVPTPKDHDSFQEEGTPLYPKIYTSLDSSDVHFVLGKIFINIIDEDRTYLTLLNIQPREIQIYEVKWFLNRPDNAKDLERIRFGMFGHSFEIFKDLDDSSKPYNRSNYIPIAKKYIQEHEPDLIINVLKEYFDRLGSTIPLKEEDLIPKGIKTNRTNEEEKAYRKSIQKNINKASAARQIFLLGQLIFDQMPTAFEELGGEEWLLQQPKEIQLSLHQYLEFIAGTPSPSTVKTERLKRMKDSLGNQSRNLLRDLNN